MDLNSFLTDFLSVLIIFSGILWAVIYVLTKLSERFPPPSTRWKLPGDVLEQFIEADDGSEITIYVKGEGRTVILIHGAGGTASHFSFLFKRLATRQKRIVALDLRGHGNSKDIGNLSSIQLAKDLEKIILTLGGEDFTLVGYGLGGYAALSLMVFGKSHVTEMVKGLVLVSAYAHRPRNWIYRFIQLCLTSGVVVHLGWRIRWFANKMSRFFFGHACTPSMQEEWRRSLLACPPSTWALIDQATKQDLTPYLPYIEVPAMVVCGLRDNMCYDAQRALTLLGKNAGKEVKRVLLERMGNVLLWEAPDRLTALISTFMEPSVVVKESKHVAIAAQPHNEEDE